jgi:hypothetical protein
MEDRKMLVNCNLKKGGKFFRDTDEVYWISVMP